jgi:hypothetical protein
MRKISRLIKFYRYCSTLSLGARRRAKGPVHAIAFGIGLAISFLLLQHTVSAPPVPSIRPLELATHRTADATRAVAPKLTGTISGPQDLRPMGTPHGETNGSVGLVPDNTFEQMLALVIREPQRPMATPRGETHGSVGLVPDNTFEQMLALVTREPQRPMATPRGETNAGFRRVRDTTFEQMLALVVREPQRPMATPRGETNASVRRVPDTTFAQVLALVVREPQRPMATPRGETNASVRPVPDNLSVQILTLHVRPLPGDVYSAHPSQSSAHRTPARTAPSPRASAQRIQARPNRTASTRARRWVPSFTKTSPTAADQKSLFQPFSARSLSDSHSREPR